MANSLQDQLLKAGLSSKKKASQINKTKAKQNKQARKHKIEQVDETKVAAEEARKARQEKDRELNRQRNAEAEKKALRAQAKQIVQHLEIQREAGEVGFNFSHEGVIKKLFISEKQQDQLAKGFLAVTECGEGYAFIPAKAVEKITSRVPDWFVKVAEVEEIDEDDPYAEFQIPDDLMW